MGPADSLPRIIKLPPALANQIAAGEVVERPASVVKELVENSLDARADHIHIQLRRGGIESIRVTDNGHGIHPEDLLLALDRHATSKLRTPADLIGVTSLGFRGEALPSIASVAAFKLTSRTAGEAGGFCVHAGPGADPGACRPAPHPVGTTVEVAGLFHQFPARRKFLRSERTEYLHVLETVRRLALSRGSVGVRLDHNGKTVFQCRRDGAGMQRRVESILGRAFASRSLGIDNACDGLRLWGWLGTGGMSRNQSDLQYFYLNGRMIRDRQVNHAVRLAYGDLIPPGRYPAYLLYLEMDAAAADVNVHPTKHEVRFRRARDVHDFIAAAVRDTLGDGARPAGPSGPGAVTPLSWRDGGAPAVLEPQSGFGPARIPGRDAETPELGHPLGHLDGRFILSERGGALVRGKT